MGLLVSVVTLTAACPAAKKSTTPPPAGKSYDEYLRDGKKPPTRPADTNERNSMRLHAIDIGQGTATLLEFPCGAMLVDTGGESNAKFDSRRALRDYLDKFFARRKDLDRTLDLLVVTHPHIDHTRSIDMVLRNYTVRNVIDNGNRHDNLGGRPQIAMHEWIAKQGKNVGHRDIRAADIDGKTGITGPVIDPISGCGRSAVDPQITALWGAETRDLASYGENPNLHSIALRVDFGKASILITGDLEYAGISRMSKATSRELLDVDVYMVGHHGSKNATTRYLMEAMTPKIAVISMSPYERRMPWTARRFGHPHQKAVKHLIHYRYGVSWSRKPIDVMIGVRGAWKDEKKEIFRKLHLTRAVYATGWDGNVVLQLFKNGWIEVKTSRAR